MAKKQKCPEFENHERWLVSFADMMTLLFAVFVVLFALKKEGADSAAVQQAAVSIQESFNEVMEEIPDQRRAGPSAEGFGVFEYHKGDRIRPTDFHQEKDPVKQEEGENSKKDSSELTKAVKLRLYGENKIRELVKTGKGLERIISVIREDDGFRVRMLASDFYKPGSYRVSPAAKKVLRQLAGTLASLDRPLTIEGHTDSVPPPNNISNWELSSLRAAYVIKYFVDELNISPKILSAAGYADMRSIASNATEETRSLNRRIEVKVHYDD